MIPFLLEFPCWPRKLQSVRLDAIRGSTALWSRGFLLGCLSAFVFAMVLAAAPQLHDQLHGLGGKTHHQCAATLMSSGSCEHFIPQTSLEARPCPPRVLRFAQPCQKAARYLDFSLLEHAPPGGA